MRNEPIVGAYTKRRLDLTKTPAKAIGKKVEDVGDS